MRVRHTGRGVERRAVDIGRRQTVVGAFMEIVIVGQHHLRALEALVHVLFSSRRQYSGKEHVI